MTGRYKLYGADFSLYSGKVRSYLYKKGIPFDEIPASLDVYRKFILPRTDLSMIPVVQTPDDEVFQDSTVIIDELEQHFPAYSVYPCTAKQKLVSLLLEVYGDEWLILPAMHYRWNFPEQNEAYLHQKFGGLVLPSWVKWAPTFLRRRLGRKLAERFKNLLPALGITAQNVGAIESSYEKLLADLELHFKHYDYLLGGRPSIADYGFIGPFYAHLYLDPYPGRHLRQTAPSVVKWIKRMTSSTPATGDFLEDDQIPWTLTPVLKRMAREQIPVIMDTDRILSRWRLSNPDQVIPRSIGKHEFAIEDSCTERDIMPYVLWMFKRPWDFYVSLKQEHKLQAIELLKRTGFADAFAEGIHNRLLRINNKLWFSIEQMNSKTGP